ncbi:MAG TPA: sigma-70 family RNA polymerase sigma factor [Thermoleophilia bacterium]|nr:sigma-70 family RNA polymerase sigma factor [Thermoleophilia bacterium]
MSSPPATAPDLVRGLRAGRRDAFERLYGEYHAPIYNLCARVLGDREEAKDVTQEVFIKAFDQLPQEDEESFRLRAWLYRVATNACFNHLRSRRKLDRGGDAGLEQAASGVDEFERARTVALVEQSLGEMNERYRTALVLKDLQGLPPEEIAEVMEISRPNADVLVHRARASFKTVFAKLAGADAAAPAALGLVLMPLSVPAALLAMPPLPAGLAPVHALPSPDIASAAGPAGAGLLAKIGAAVTTKAAVTAAAAAVVIGGGAVAVKEGARSERVPAAAATSAPVGAGSQTPSPYTAMHDRHRAGHGARWGEHGEAARHAGSAGHDSDGGHDAATHDSTATSTHDAGDAGGSTTTHDAAGDSTTTTHDGGTSTTDSTSTHSTSTTTTHDGGDTSGSHDGGTGD